MKRLSEIITELLKTRKITQRELCKKVGIAEGYLGDIKTGRTVGSEISIQAIIDGLMLTKEEEHEVWKAWTYEKGHKRTMEYYYKLEEKYKKLKKILKVFFC